MAIGNGTCDRVMIEFYQEYLAIFEGNAGFVEGHVASSAYADNLEVNPSSTPDLAPVAIQDDRFYPGEVWRRRLRFDHDRLPRFSAPLLPVLRISLKLFDQLLLIDQGPIRYACFDEFLFQEADNFLTHEVTVALRMHHPLLRVFSREPHIFVEGETPDPSAVKLSLVGCPGELLIQTGRGAGRGPAQGKIP